MQNVAKVIAEADTIIMFGIGTSGSMAQYGSRLFANYGLYTVGITDPFQPQPSGQHDYDKTILICLSVSGRSEQVLRQARFYSEQGAQYLPWFNQGMDFLPFMLVGFATGWIISKLKPMTNETTATEEN